MKLVRFLFASAGVLLTAHSAFASADELSDFTFVEEMFEGGQTDGPESCHDFIFYFGQEGQGGGSVAFSQYTALGLEMSDLSRYFIDCCVGLRGLPYYRPDQCATYCEFEVPKIRVPEERELNEFRQEFFSECVVRKINSRLKISIV